MKKIILILLSLVAMACISVSYAGSGVPCPPIKVQSKNNAILLKNTEKSASSVYFLQNVSKEPLFLDHPSGKNGMGAGFTSIINPNHWSAVAITRKNYPVSCSTQTPSGKKTMVDCSKALVVCVPPNLSTENLEHGTFWIVEDKKLEAFLKELAAKGISY